MQNIHKDIQTPPVLRELQKITFDLICFLPKSACADLTFNLVMLYLISTHEDLQVDKLPALDGLLKLKDKISVEFLKAVKNLRLIKKIVTKEERLTKVVKTRVLSALTQKYTIAISSQELAHVAFSLHSLVFFASPRFLIQEVTQSIKKEPSPHEVNVYFSHAIENFRDDLQYMGEITQLVQTLPLRVREALSLIFTEQLKDLPEKDTSAVL